MSRLLHISVSALCITCMLFSKGDRHVRTGMAVSRESHIAFIQDQAEVSRSFLDPDTRQPMRRTNPFQAALQEYIMTMDPATRKIPAHRSVQAAIIIYRESSGTGTGIMRSRDAGDTWEVMPSTTGFARYS